MEILKVSAQSDASATAGALANTIRESGEAELQGIGPKAINQAVKAIAIARSYLASSGVDLVAMPSFVDVEIDGEQRTALRFSIMPRHRLHQPHEDGRPTASEADAAEDWEEPSPEREPEPTEPEGDAPQEEIAPSRPTSLSEAIRGRPASELEASEASDDEEESSDAAEADDPADDPASHEDPPERRSSFFGRSRRAEVDTDRDVF